MRGSPGYTPLNLARWCNADGSLINPGYRVPAGRVAFHGIPFRIGKTGRRPMLAAFGEGVGMAAAVLPVRARVRHVVFAHRLIDSAILDGGPVGRACAEYAFRFGDGRVETAAIRDRLEIAALPYIWGQLPILGAPDGKDAAYRESRQTQAAQGWAKDFVIWSWENPRPEVRVEAVEIRPAGPRFVLGGVTLSRLAEPPLHRSAKRAVKLVLRNKRDAGKPFGLEVAVDRGAATLPYALPEAGAGRFLKDPFAGWGEAQNEKSSPAYVEIAANPSATVEVRQDGRSLGAANWGELQRRGRARTPRLDLIVMDRGRNWVRTEVLDDETGRPVPCRIHFRTPQGVPYQPHGHHDRVNGNFDTWHVDIGGDLRLGQVTYAYINGRCEGWLPRGDVIVDIARGYEYRPIRRKIRIVPGQQRLAFRLKRLRNMARERYFSGDTHVHFLSTQGGHLEAAGEGVNVVNLLLSQWGHLFTNTEEFTGRPSVSPDGETIVYASQENRQHLLGHLTLLGLKEPVMPWCSDGPSEAELGGNLETTLSRWADACHAQGGTVVVPHLPNPNCEPAALIATGRADAVEMFIHDKYMHNEYYRYLNMGYRLPLVGGTDKMTASVPVGVYRTYVHVPKGERFTYENWCRHLRAGHTMISAGPLMSFTVEGKPIGATVRLPGNGGTVEVAASAESVLPFNTLDLVMNGTVVARAESRRAVKRLSLRRRVRVDRHSWIAARCGGPDYFTSIRHHDGWRRGLMAHTSPVYLAVGGPWWMFDADAAKYMLTLLKGGLDYIHRRSVQWEKGAVTHHHGRADHEAFLSEPFQQAIEAIHKRMHDLGIPH